MQKMVGVGLMLLVFSTAYATSIPSVQPPFRKSAGGVLSLNNAHSKANALMIKLAAPIAKKTLGKAKFGRLQIGFSRPVPKLYANSLTKTMVWQTTSDGRAIGSVIVQSPDASALRAKVMLLGLEGDVDVKFFSQSNQQKILSRARPRQLPRSTEVVKGTVSKGKPQLNGAVATQTFWTPVMDGENLGIEITLSKGENIDNVEIYVTQVSHLTQSPAKSLRNIGASQACEIDVACELGNGVGEVIRNATAKMVFTDSTGTFLCTGTLLNDREQDEFTPYFLSANHCLATQATASTLNTFWFFERANCNGANPTSVTQLTGGAELVSTGRDSDYTLLRLLEAQPNGASFSGSDTQFETALTAVHHPSGDLKKVSQGRLIENRVGVPTAFAGIELQSTFVVSWATGTTEGGSSGSGIFIDNARLVGTLSGGAASCTNPTGNDFYGRFTDTFNDIERFIFTVADLLANQTTTVATDATREFKVIVGANTPQLTVTIDSQSGDADLFVRRGSRASVTSTQFNDCSSFLATNIDTCTIDSPTPGTYYVTVHGFLASTFQLTSNVESSVEFFKPTWKKILPITPGI